MNRLFVDHKIITVNRWWPNTSWKFDDDDKNKSNRHRGL